MWSPRTSTSSPTMTSSPLYRDTQYSRLPNVLGAFIVLGTAIAVGAIYGDAVRATILAVGLLALALIAVRTRLHVVVDAEGLALGRARIDWQWIDRVEVLEGAAMRAALTVDGHPRDYLQIRGTQAGLRAWLKDPDDPHRRWLASVKRPLELRETLDRLGIQVTHAA